MAAQSASFISGLLGRRDRAPAEVGVLVAFVAFIVLLAIFVIYPTLEVLSYPSLEEYLTILRGSRWLVSARNSLLVTLLSTTTATFVGFVFAFAVTRHDFPARRFFRILGMLPLFAPPFMVAFSYILLLAGKAWSATESSASISISSAFTDCGCRRQSRSSHCR